jgi:CheY-like chemotaxis protein
MSAETLGRIFEPFFTTKDAGHGTGLGLAVVHGIVEAHEGVITAESRHGLGTTFQVYFPALAQTEKPAEEPVLKKYQGDGEHILFVDDDKSIVHLARAVLKRLNYRVRAFDQPEEALAAFLEEPERYSLVISDLTMPKMTGETLAQHIGKVRQDLPILIITGYGGSLELENLRKSALRDVLFKPFSNDTLASSIHQLLERAHLIRAESPDLSGATGLANDSI